MNRIKILALLLLGVTANQFCSTASTTTTTTSSVPSTTQERAKVIFFNVGQGNCTLIVEPSRPGILIDAGSKKYPENGKQAVINEIVATINQLVLNKELQIIISHPDEDHASIVAGIIQGLRRHRFAFYQPIVGGHTADYHDEKNILNTAIDELNRLGCRDAASFNDVSELQILLQQLNPNIQILASNPNAVDNDKSIVVKYTFPQSGNSFFIGGDASYKILKNIDPRLMSSAVYLANHHGADSHGSNCEELVSKINPMVGIFSANGLHKHPRTGAVTNIAQSVVSRNLTVPAHLVTYGHTDADGVLARNGAGQIIKAIIRRTDGFDVAITNLPIFSTHDSGTVVVHESMTPENIVGLEVRSLRPELTMSDCYNQALTTNFNNISEIDLSGTGAAHLLLTMPMLPRALHYLNVAQNGLTKDQIYAILSRIPSIRKPAGSITWPNWQAASPRVRLVFADYSYDTQTETNKSMGMNDLNIDEVRKKNPGLLSEDVPQGSISLFDSGMTKKGLKRWIAGAFNYYRNTEDFKATWYKPESFPR